MFWLTAIGGFGLSAVFLLRQMPWVGLGLGAHTLLFVLALRHGSKPSLATTRTRARKLVFLLGAMATTGLARPDVSALIWS